jgi:hypothetical protein
VKDMAGMFGDLFSFKSKEEKARSYDAFSNRVFPYGDEQRDKILEILTELFPKEKARYVLMHYILVKDGMTGEDSLDFEEASKKVKHSPIKATAEIQAGIRALVNADFNINEKLEYPSLEELRTAAKEILSEN